MEKVIGLKAGYSWQMAHNISLFLLWLHLLSNSTRKGPTFEWLYMVGFFLWMSCELKQRCLSWARGWIKWPLEFPSEFSYSSVPAMLSVLLMSPANSRSDIKWLCSCPRQTCARGSFRCFPSPSMPSTTLQLLVTGREGTSSGKMRNNCTELSKINILHNSCISLLYNTWNVALKLLISRIR